METDSYVQTKSFLNFMIMIFLLTLMIMIFFNERFQSEMSK